MTLPDAHSPHDAAARPPAEAPKGPNWDLVIGGVLAGILAAWLAGTRIYHWHLDIDVQAFWTVSLVGLGLALVLLGLVGLTRRNAGPR